MPGKLQPDILNSNVLKFCGAHRNDLLIGGGLAEDAALIHIPDGFLAVASDPITGASAHAGKLLVHINANDIACKGATPSWIIVTLIVPDKLGIDFIQNTMREIHNTCLDLNIAIAGGHTELSNRYDSPVLSATILGMTDYLFSAKNIQPDHSIIATGHAGLEGMSIIAHDHPQLFNNIFSEQELSQIRSWQENLSVVKPAKILREFACYMHDPTEGGLNGALYEICLACSLGIEMSMDNVPISPLTLRAAQHLGFNPMNLISSGMLLAVIPPQNVQQALQALKHEGIPSSIIGKFVSGEGNVKLDAHEELWTIL